MAQTPASDPKAASPAAPASTQSPARANEKSPAPIATQPSSPGSPSTAASSDDEMVQLSPFEVRTEKDTSYGALNSNSIARFNTELSKVPISADIFTEDFMNDVGTTTIEGLLTSYGAGTGMVLATPDSDANNNQPGDRFSVSQIGVRGLSGGNIRRDGFEISGTNTNDTSSAFVERVEVIRGPQGLLYGAGGAGGTITSGSKRANFNRNSSSVSFRVDQFGSKRLTFDTNVGRKNVAARFVVLDDTVKHRRLFIGNETKGLYGQLAFRLPLRTTLRIQGERTDNNRIVPNNQGDLNFGSTATDPRHNYSLAYLLATNQAGPSHPVTGATFPRGAVLNGQLTWENASSFAGDRSREDIENDVVIVSADTVWSKWLSTNIGYAYNKSHGLRGTDFSGLSAPLANANPMDRWAVGSNYNEDENASKRNSFRAAALLSKDLFQERLRTQTAFGIDYDEQGSGRTQWGYYLSDAAGNIIRNPTSTQNLQRTAMGRQWWTVDNGLTKYPFAPQGTVTFRGTDGQYYTRDPRNPRSAAWITPNNPLGLASMFFPSNANISGDNKAGYADEREVTGIFGANSISWFNDRVETLIGFRRTTTKTVNPNTTASIPRAYSETERTNDSYNFGVNVRALSWLRPYYGLSSTFNNASGANDPLGNPPKTTEGFGQEIGVKFNPLGGRISGSLQYYWTDDKNQNYNYGTALRDLINPSGLNGVYDGVAGRNQWVSLDKTSRGVELILTAAPTRNWRVRLSATQSDGRVGTDKIFPILYNDQFYVNSSGGVTYSNGAPVMVPVTVPASGGIRSLNAPVDPATIVTPSTPATQLTTAMISDPNSEYYAWGRGNAQQINGRITGTVLSNVLRFFNLPGVGTPLTGVTGLPISAIQYGWTDPANTGGQIVAARNGEYTVGYAAYRVSLTNLYTFSSGMLKGTGVGFSYNQSWDNRTYYYNNPDRTRHLFRAPLTGAQVDVILSYTRKFDRLTWRTQLNIYNIANHYKLGFQPNNGTGFTNEANIGANFYGQPRLYAWTNTFSF